MMRKCSFTLSLLLVVLVSIVLLGTGSSRAAQPLGPVKLLSTVPVPVSATNTTGGMYSFDISWVDRTTGTYYREHSVILTLSAAAVNDAQTPDRRSRYTWHSAALTCGCCWPHTTRPLSA